MGHASGGIVILVKNSIKTTVIDKSDSWILLHVEATPQTFILCYAYFRPDRPLAATLDLLQESLDDLSSRFADLPWFVAGDFNARIGNLGQLAEDILESTAFTAERASLDEVISAKGRRLVNFMGDNGFILLNGRSRSDSPANFTFCGECGKSVIDLVWTNAVGASLARDLGVRQILTGSDHFPVELYLDSESPAEPINIQ